MERSGGRERDQAGLAAAGVPWLALAAAEGGRIIGQALDPDLRQTATG